MSSNSKKPIYLFYLFIIIALGMLVLSLYYTLDAFLALQGGLNSRVTYQLMTGLFGVIVSIYMFTQFRKRMTLIKPSEPHNMITIVECKKCGLKSLRKFAKEDFVFKNVEDCGKCNEPMLITGIYAEKVKK